MDIVTKIMTTLHSECLARSPIESHHINEHSELARKIVEVIEDDFASARCACDC